MVYDITYNEMDGRAGSGKLRIRQYQTSSGKVPFEEWLNRLEDRKGRAIIRIRIERLALGNPGRCKALGGGLFELKIEFGPGYRVYFGRCADLIVILLSGGDKSSQSRDIRQAKKYWDDYRSAE